MAKKKGRDAIHHSNRYKYLQYSTEIWQKDENGKYKYDENGDRIPNEEKLKEFHDTDDQTIANFLVNAKLTDAERDRVTDNEAKKAGVLPTTKGLNIAKNAKNVASSLNNATVLNGVKNATNLSNKTSTTIKNATSGGSISMLLLIILFVLAVIQAVTTADGTITTRINLLWQSLMGNTSWAGNQQSTMQLTNSQNIAVSDQKKINSIPIPGSSAYKAQTRSQQLNDTTALLQNSRITMR